MSVHPSPVHLPRVEILLQEEAHLSVALVHQLIENLDADPHVALRQREKVNVHGSGEVMATMNLRQAKHRLGGGAHNVEKRMELDRLRSYVCWLRWAATLIRRAR